MNEKTKTLINTLLDWRQNPCKGLCDNCTLNDDDLCGYLVYVANNIAYNIIIANIGEFTSIGESGSYGTLGEWEELDKE